MRLDKFLSHATGLTRSKARAALKRKQVQVNGEIKVSASEHIRDADIIEMNGEVLKRQGDVYLMLYKPTGYCCSHVDDGHPSALSLIPVEPRHANLSFAGRLDANTSGLVLLSTDGQWLHRITSPKQKVKKEKVYEVLLDRPLSSEAKEKLERGLMLKNEDTPTLPARLIEISPHKWRIAISEGRYHQVRRMFAAVGNHVLELHRSKIGELTLDAKLAPGESRTLTEEEVKLFS